MGALDMIFPGNTSIDTQYDVEALVNTNTDLSLMMYGNIRADKFGEPIKSSTIYRPKLRTGFAPKRMNHLTTVVSAVYKRNAVLAHHAYPNDYLARAHEAIEYAFDVILQPEWRSVLQKKREYPVSINDRTVELWAECQVPEKLQRLESTYNGRNIWDLDVNEYSIFLKPFNKPPSDTSIQKEVQQPQTVVFSDVVVNAHFGPVFRELEDIFRSLLKPNVLYNKKKNIGEIEEFINSCDSTDPEDEFAYVENDFSSYDKSQHIETWILEREVYRLLGCDEDLLQHWEDGHWFTKIRSPSVGFTMYTLFQRKSGDVTTSFGNTLVNMITMIYSYRYVDIEYGLFLGDDSLIKVRKTLINQEAILHAQQMLIEAFNLPSKAFVFKFGYFCGLAIVKVGQKNVVISDPIRRAVKLGRADIKNREDFKEHWTSLNDVTRNYDNDLVINSATDAMCERYPIFSAGQIYMLFLAVGSIGRSYKEFRKLWEEELVSIHY
jgi:hypothetical protein